jgi:hypothetical protein
VLLELTVFAKYALATYKTVFALISPLANGEQRLRVNIDSSCLDERATFLKH